MQELFVVAAAAGQLDPGDGAAVTQSVGPSCEATPRAYTDTGPGRVRAWGSLGALGPGRRTPLTS